MTIFKKIEAGKCRECGNPVYLLIGTMLGFPHYLEIGKDKICKDCFKKNPDKYVEEKEKNK